MKTTVLLGAGSSQAAFFPSTLDLTQQVESGIGVTKSLGSTEYDIDSTDQNQTLDSRVLPVVRLIQQIKSKAVSYYKDYKEFDRASSINYEELYYLIKQAFDDYTGDLENPAIHKFTRDLEKQVSDLLDGNSGDRFENRQKLEIHELCHEALNYVVSVVWKRLTKHSPDTKLLSHLNTLVSACKSGEVNCIATLCHDTHVERVLTDHGVQLEDGFADYRAGFRRWQGWHNECPSTSGIPFLKLHGSVNWFSYGSGYNEKIAMPFKDRQRMILPKDQILYAHTDGPLLLIGTFNKMSEYSSRLFSDIHCRFRQALNRSVRLVVCGYSFGDKRINEVIIEWVFRNTSHRLVVIHPDPQLLIEHARIAIKQNIYEWEKEKSIVYIGKLFQDIDLSDLLTA